jgi:acyl carrier protein
MMEQQIDTRSVQSVQMWLMQWMQTELSLETSSIDPSQALLSYGMDSVHAMMLVGDLEGHLGTQLSPTLAWDYPTVQALAEHVVERASCPATGGNGQVKTGPRESGARTTQDARTLLSQLDGMSEEEMDALLEQYSNTGH